MYSFGIRQDCRWEGERATDRDDFGARRRFGPIRPRGWIDGSWRFGDGIGGRRIRLAFRGGFGVWAWRGLKRLGLGRRVPLG